jgi:hypothetical protein
MGEDRRQIGQRLEDWWGEQKNNVKKRMRWIITIIYINKNYKL